MRGCRVSSTVGSSEQTRQMAMKIILLGAVAGIRSVLLSTFFLKDYILEQIHLSSCTVFNHNGFQCLIDETGNLAIGYWFYLPQAHTKTASSAMVITSNLVTYLSRVVNH